MGDLAGLRFPFEGQAPAPRPTPTPAVAPVAEAGGMDRDMLRQLILQELRELTRGQS
jgi:hypothetical protein